MKKFPKTLYVRRESEGTEDEHLLCDDVVKNFALAGETEHCAVYELKGVAAVRAPVAVTMVSGKGTKRR